MMKGISPMERVIFIFGWNDIKAGQLRWYTVRCVGTLFPRSAVTISPKGWFLWKWGSYLNFKRKGVSPTGCWVYRIIAEKRRQDRISRWKGLILWREVITFSVFTKCAASVLKGGGRLILPKGWLSYDHKRILWSEYLNDNAREWVRHRSNFTAWMLKGSGRISPRKGSDDVMKKRFHILCIC